MPKRVALYACLCGYLIATWYYGLNFAPFKNESLARDILWYSCPSCMSVDGSPAGVMEFCLLVIAPINGILFAVVGFVAAKLLSTSKGRSQNVS